MADSNGFRSLARIIFDLNPEVTDPYRPNRNRSYRNFENFFDQILTKFTIYNLEILHLTNKRLKRSTMFVLIKTFEAISEGLVPQGLSSPRKKKNDFPTARPTRLELFSDPDFLFDIFLSPLSREFETYSRLTFNFVTYSRNGFVNNSHKAFSSK